MKKTGRVLLLAMTGAVFATSLFLSYQEGRTSCTADTFEAGQEAGKKAAYALIQEKIKTGLEGHRQFTIREIGYEFIPVNKIEWGARVLITPLKKKEVGK